MNTVNHVYGRVDEDFAATNQFIIKSLDSNVPLVREVGEYIVGAGGKRLRPRMVLLAARSLGYEGDRHVELAAVIELLHTATLLHDDVVDGSSLRRGRATANVIWGNPASVLVGDFLISRAFQVAVGIGNQRLLQVLADSTNVISEGEVWQLLNCKDPDTTEADYLRVIHHKTAKMFEAATRIGAILAQSSREQTREEQALAAYGQQMGMAFQLIDDALDYLGDVEELGKNVGDDLAEGKPTLPLIHTLRQVGDADKAKIRQAILHGGLEQLDDIVALVKNHGGLDYTMTQARRYTQQALTELGQLPASAYRDVLEQLAIDAIERQM